MYAWAKGATFKNICSLTDQMEGSVIRCIRRLEEILREVVSACHAMGSKDLEMKFNKSRELIKRDIVFAASLYLT